MGSELKKLHLWGLTPEFVTFLALTPRVLFPVFEGEGAAREKTIGEVVDPVSHHHAAGAAYLKQPGSVEMAQDNVINPAFGLPFDKCLQIGPIVVLVTAFPAQFRDHACEPNPEIGMKQPEAHGCKPAVQGGLQGSVAEVPGGRDTVTVGYEDLLAVN